MVAGLKGLNGVVSSLVGISGRSFDGQSWSGFGPEGQKVLFPARIWSFSDTLTSAGSAVRSTQPAAAAATAAAAMNSWPVGHCLPHNAFFREMRQLATHS